MTLNANFAGAKVLVGRQKLQGSDRGLDVVIGLVILVAEALIGILSISALFAVGSAAISADSSAAGEVTIGFGLALFGSAIIVGITLLVYLVRVATGKRSWRGPLVGAILMTVVISVGYAIIASTT